MGCAARQGEAENHWPRKVALIPAKPGDGLRNHDSGPSGVSSIASPAVVHRNRAATINPRDGTENGPGLAIQAIEDSVTNGSTDHATAPLCCFTAARLHRLEISLRTSVKLVDDEDTMVHLADLAVRVQRRRHAHEGFCPVCLSQGKEPW